MTQLLQLLVVEDNPSDFRLMQMNFSRAGFAADCIRVDTLPQLRSTLHAQKWDAVLLDYNLPKLQFSDAMAAVHEFDISLPVILISGSILEEKALRMLQDGLWDYVSKDHLIRLPSAITRSLDQARTKKDLRAAEHELKISALAFESSDSIVITDGDGNVERVNSSFSISTGVAADVALGQKFPQFMVQEKDRTYFDVIWEKIRYTGKWQGETELVLNNGTRSTFWITITGVKDDCASYQHFIFIAHDISARKAAEDEIARLAYYDSLTGLPNRRLLIDRLRLALSAMRRNGQRGALMFIDLDRFKNINDTLGHECGDALLVEISRRLGDCVRVNDMVARLGGDEFVVMLENLSGSDDLIVSHVQAVSDKLRCEIARELVISGQSIYVTLSVGIALFGDDDKTVDDLLRWADLAMYQAKGAGRNSTVFFDPQMQATILRRTTLEADMRRAITRREFRLVYQPKVNRQSVVNGFEALVRWHRDGGDILPVEFIPIAEESGLILPLGGQIFEMACLQLKQMTVSSVPDMTFAVNVSLRQFQNPNFCEEIETRLVHFGIASEMLVLEVTESLLAERIDDVSAKMSYLKNLGVRFALDDFGTGYASLSHLRQLPFDQVKIDRSFVNNMLVNSSDSGLVRTIIAMAHTLDLEVIAEGVETEDQWQFLLAEGCDGAQGFLFSQPLEADALRFGRLP